MFRASQCSSSGDRIILIHNLVWLVCVSDCLVCRSGGNCSWCIKTIRPPDDEHLKLEICTEMKWINKYTKKCIILVIKKNSWRDAQSTKRKIRFIISGSHLQLNHYIHVLYRCLLCDVTIFKVIYVTLRLRPRGRQGSIPVWSTSDLWASDALPGTSLFINNSATCQLYQPNYIVSCQVFVLLVHQE
jgi:hypothetical protein